MAFNRFPVVFSSPMIKTTTILAGNDRYTGGPRGDIMYFLRLPGLVVDQLRLAGLGLSRHWSRAPPAGGGVKSARRSSRPHCGREGL
jgi:hypothetical protein